MNREIKYRQPLYHNGKTFSEFHYWGFDKYGIFTAPCGNLNDIEKEKGQCQFTGLKDKKGVDIYEGDVCKYGTHCLQVTYCEKFACFSLIDNAGKHNLFADGADPSIYAEVIGNIHSDPHLINQLNITAKS